MFKIYSFIFVLMCSFSHAQAMLQEDGKSSGNTCDGPYVFYKGDSIIVKQIEVRNGQAVVVTNRYPARDRAKIQLNIRFSDHPEKDFKVRLQSELKNEPCIWPQPDKLLAISDIEGEFDALRDLLLANKVIDKDYKWLFGKGHVVLCGDLFDRGKDVPATIWLLYKLEQEAKLNGGYFHIVLGNHDIMNLSGDLRYLQPKYKENAALLGIDYMELYNKETELGVWLRTKNLIEKIGENLCLHGGVSPEINAAGLSLAEINALCRPFYDRGRKADLPDNELIKMFFSGKTSLFWFRGYFNEPVVDEKVVDETLAKYQVKRIIVGHTITNHNIGFYYHGKVLGVDVDHHEGKHEAARYENGKWYKVNLTGKLNEMLIRL